MSSYKSDAVVFYVSDIKKVVTWYSKLLGFAPSWDGLDYAYIAVDNTRIGFRTARGRNRSKNVIYLNVPKLSDKMEAVENMGGSIHKAPTQTPLGEYSCVMLDPFGNYFGLTSWLK